MSRILVPNRNLIVPPQIGAGVGVAGFVRMQVLRSDGSVKHDTGEFPNLITNTGLDRMGYASGESGYYNLHYDRCHVGSGNTAPAFTDIALASPLGSVNSVTGAYTMSVSGASPWYSQNVQQYDFAVGQIVGNVAEVGFAARDQTTAPGNHLAARALIVDGGGTPTTISVLADEMLRVFYTRRIYCNESDVNQTINLSGTPYDTVLRPAEVDNVYHWCRSYEGFNKNSGGFYINNAWVRNGDIGAITADATSSGGYQTYKNSFDVASTYVPGNYYRDIESHFTAGEANFPTGVKSFSFGCGFGYWQVRFVTAIPKTNLQILKLKARISWARHTP
mgnify:CR=1 FL=1